MKHCRRPDDDVYNDIKEWHGDDAYTVEITGGEPHGARAGARVDGARVERAVAGTRKGSHRVFAKPGRRPIVVPLRPKRGTVLGILRRLEEDGEADDG